MTKLTKYEETILYQLIEKVTGCHQQGLSQKQIFVSNVESLMKEAGKKFEEYLYLISKDAGAFSKFIASVTIHTTSWFREPEHFEILESSIRERIKAGQMSFRVWSAASSTGQEAYTIGLVFQNLKFEFPRLEYKIFGTDIDVLSVEKAKSAVYPLGQLRQIPRKYEKFIFRGENKAASFFTIDPEIRKMCSFKVENLNAEKFDDWISSADFIFCRNALIYFHSSKVRGIVDKIITRLRPEGLLFLSHSEALVEKVHSLLPLGRAVYQKNSQLSVNPVQGAQDLEPKTVLIIEEDKGIQFLLKQKLGDEGFHVLLVESCEEATKVIVSKRVDLIAVDLHLPGKGGISWLRDFRARGYSTPVIILSGAKAADSTLVYEAFEKGAQEFFEKEHLANQIKRFVQTAKALVGEDKDSGVVYLPSPGLDQMVEKYVPELIVIGAGTGGPAALWKLLDNISQPCPPIMVVQHTSPHYASYFAETLSGLSGLAVSEMRDGERILKNHIYLARGDYDIQVGMGAQGLVLKHTKPDGPRATGPSVDALFKSVAKLELSTLAILLTGLGEDGAQGMAEIFAREQCFNIAQSKDSSVIYGMPRAATKLKCVHWVADVDFIRGQIDKCIVSYQLKIQSAPIIAPRMTRRA